MILNDLFLFIKDRAGESNEEYILRQINYVVSRTWLTTDLPGSLYEMVVEPSTERITILPWYVNQVKAVRRAGVGEVTLYTPRPWYQSNGGYQYPLQWVELESTPLMRNLTNVGRLRLRLRTPATAPFSVTLAGPGEFGSKLVQTVQFDVGDTEQVTPDTISDIISLGKTTPTVSDVLIYDITGLLVAVLPAERTDVRNKKIRITDQQAMPIVTGTCNRFSVLYKATMPVYQSLKETIDDSTGQIIQNLVVADILAKSNETSAMNRMRFHGGLATTLLDEAQRHQNEGKIQFLDLTRDPFTHEYSGWL
jgi:hypothetical protein